MSENNIPPNDENKRRNSFSKSYEEAQRKGLKLMFVCREGRERSRIATELAHLRGEENTDFLPGGIYSIYRPQDDNFDYSREADEERQIKIQELLKTHHLRVIEDPTDEKTKEYEWFKGQLNAMAEEGKGFEFVSYETVLKENSDLSKSSK